jgi:hypothetical protein
MDAAKADVIKASRHPRSGPSVSRTTWYLEARSAITLG